MEPLAFIFQKPHLRLDPILIVNLQKFLYFKYWKSFIHFMH